MNPIVTRLIEAGIIDKDTVLALEKWGHLEPGTADLVGTKKPRTKKARMEFAEEIAGFLDTEREEAPKSTRLEVHATPPFLVVGLSTTVSKLEFHAVWDDMRHLICAPDVAVREGDWLQIGEQAYQVDLVEKLYQGETLAALQLTVVQG